MATENINIQDQQTTNATPLAVVIKSLLPDSRMAALVTIVAADSAGNARRWSFFRTAKRVGTGSATLVGTAPVAIGEQDSPMSSAAAAAGVSGNNFIVTLTGIAATTINWTIGGMITSSK